MQFFRSNQINFNWNIIDILEINPIQSTNLQAYTSYNKSQFLFSSILHLLIFYYNN
jgi:hypothetical protein